MPRLAIFRPQTRNCWVFPLPAICPESRPQSWNIPLSVQIRGLGLDSTSLPGMLGGPGYDMGTHDSHQGEIEIHCETFLWCLWMYICTAMYVCSIVSNKQYIKWCVRTLTENIFRCTLSLWMFFFALHRLYFVRTSTNLERGVHRADTNEQFAEIFCHTPGWSWSWQGKW